jgi:quercetin dioxygenase-like cupin family protein
MKGRTMAGMYTLGQGEGEATWFLQNRMELKATAETTDGAYGLVESTIAPGASPPLHIHRREDEAFYVLEGEMTFHYDGEDYPAGPGTFVFLPRDVPHTFVVEGDRPARVLTLMSPGGGERFFVDGGRAPESEGLPPAGPPDIERMQRAAAVYESEIVGPPIQPRAQAAT